MLCDLESNEQRVYKTPSTPVDPSLGFMTGLTEILSANGVSPADVVHILHGTTIATNSVLETRAPPSDCWLPKFQVRAGNARHGTPRLANPNTWVKPDRPVRPRNCMEVTERTSFDGEILMPMDESAVREAARHFQRAGIARWPCIPALLREPGPRAASQRDSDAGTSGRCRVPIIRSLAVYREYERTITTVLNAYVTPRVSRYIDNLKRSLHTFGTGAAFSIMKSNGGIIGADTAVEQPVYTALSRGRPPE